MNIAVTLATLVGGLGLFFFGMELLATNLRRMTSQRFQRAVASATADPWKSLAAGCAFGAVTQSLNAIAFITIGLVSAGFIALSAALPLLIGANMGATLLAYFATLDIATAMLFVVGVTAFMLTRESFRSWHNAIGCVFGAALLFTGLAFVQEAARPLAEEPWFRTMLLSAVDVPVVAFLVGTLASFVVQGSLAVTILTMNFHASGLVDYDSAVLLTYATNVGSSLALALLSIGLSGVALQIAAFGIGFNIVGALVMLPLYWVETSFGVPLVLAGIAVLTDDPELRVVLAYLLFNVAAAVVLFALREPAGRLLVRLFPEPPETEAARPVYLQRVALEDPGTALLLADREQARALDLMEGLLEAGRMTDAAERQRQTEIAAGAVDGLLAAIRAYLDEIRARAEDAEVRAGLTRLYDRQESLAALAETLAALAAAPAAAGEGAGALRLALLEAVDTIRTHLVATVAEPDPVSVELLEAMVGEKGEILARIRTSYLERESAEDTLARRLELLDLTALFERAVWQLRRLSHALLAGVAAGPAGGVPPT